MTREEPIYAMLECEIDTISTLNSTTAMCLSFGTGILGFGLSRVADLAVATVPEEWKRWAYAIPIAAGVIGAALVVLAVFLAYKAKKQRDRIKLKGKGRGSGADPMNRTKTGR